MAIDVRVTANMQKHLGGERSIKADSANVRELLADIDRRFPGFHDMVMTDGEIHRFVNIYLNDEDIRFLDQLDTALNDGDVVSILKSSGVGIRRPWTTSSRASRAASRRGSSIRTRIVWGRSCMDCRTVWISPCATIRPWLIMRICRVSDSTSCRMWLEITMSTP